MITPSISDSDIDLLGETGALVKAMTPQEQAEFYAALKVIKTQPRSLMRFIAESTPGNLEPDHLKPLVDALERSRHEQVRLVVSTPPQHFKSSTIQAALVWMLQQSPKRHGYITYSDSKAEEVSRQTQWLADRVGLEYSGNLSYWTTPDHGSIKWAGIGGALTGHAIDGLLCIDDPIKNREEAESGTYRDHTDDWFRSVAMTRLHPKSSCIVIATRWHEDDLSGRLIKRGWDSVNLPAITPDGFALCESLRPLSFLKQQQAELGEYEWSALYMGNPRSREGKLFRGVDYYAPDALPKRMSIAIGVDGAYSAKTHADWSSAVVLGEYDAHWYVLDVIHKQCEAPVFVKDLQRLAAEYPGAPMMWDTSTTEKGQADILRALADIPLGSRLAKGDPFMRAQRVAAAWNRKRVHVPRSNPTWLRNFMRELDNATGINDKHDDQIAALASAFSMLPAEELPAAKPPVNSREWQLSMMKDMETRLARDMSGNNEEWEGMSADD